jgi:hypothetical protein
MLFAGHVAGKICYNLEDAETEKNKKNAKSPQVKTKKAYLIP